MSLSPEQSKTTSPSGNGSGEGEHKVISVLFTDVVNYTALSEKLDLELVREIISNHFNLLFEAANSYQGTVDRLLGDGMVVFFGAPVAYEDHAQRACYTALAMQKAMREYAETIQKSYGIEFRVRIGINSGPVLVGTIGNDRHNEHMVIGDTVNLASRMEEASRPGGILVSANTYALAGDFFRFESIGEIGIKGKENPIAAYRLIHAMATDTRFDAAIAKGLSRFVGREDEIRILQQAFNNAADGNGHVVGISGEPGIGKSRLLREFRESLNSEEINYLEGGCLHYSNATPFAPLVDIAKAYFEIDDNDEVSDAKKKIAEKLTNLDESLTAYLPFLYEMLSFSIEDEHYLRMENQYKRSKLFEGLTMILLKEADPEPLIVAIEDLHWMDRASEEFLTHLINAISNSRILLVLLYRPEYRAPWIGQPGYIQVHLDQLSASSSNELLQSLLPGGDAESELKDLVLARSGGNPLFEEELVSALIDSGSIQKDGGRYTLSALASTVALPNTIQGIIAARIDRLPEGLKTTLQVASVMGRDFNYAVLEDITQLPQDLKSQLDELQQLEFILQGSRSEEIEYTFKHALIQEVAYESLLQKRRRELHEKIGTAIEKLYPQRIDEMVEMLAYHYQLSNTPDKAIEYLRKSGRKALTRFAVETSHQYYQKAYDIISARTVKNQEDQSTLLDILLEWAVVYYYRGHFRELSEFLICHQALIELPGDKSRPAMFLGWLGHSFFTAGKLRESYESLQKALVLAEESADPKAIAYVCTWLVYTCGFTGLTKEGLAYGEKAVEASRQVAGDDYPYIKSLGGWGYLLSSNGQTLKALECGQKLIDFGHAHGNLRSLAMGYWTLGFGYANAGDMEAAYEICQKGLRLNPDTIYLELLRWEFGYICILAGRLQEGETILNEVSADCQKYGVDAMGWLSSAQLGMILISKGQMGKGFHMMSEAHHKLVKNNVKQYYTLTLYLLGMLYSQLAFPAAPVKFALLLKNLGFILRTAPFAKRKAIAYYVESAAICRDCGFQAMLGMILLELGRLYKKAGKRELAMHNLAEAVKLCQECGAVGSVKQAQDVLKSLENEK